MHEKLQDGRSSLHQRLLHYACYLDTGYKVAKLTGPLSYYVTLLDSRVVCRHVDALHNREVLYPIPKPPQAQSDDSEDDLFLPDISATTPTCAIPTAAPVQPACSCTSI